MKHILMTTVAVLALGYSASAQAQTKIELQRFFDLGGEDGALFVKDDGAEFAGGDVWPVEADGGSFFGEALEERETLLVAMPHISWPMRFVLPWHPEMRFESDTPTSRLLSKVMPWMKGRRPAWLIRLGLFLYDTLGGRKILPATRTLDLTRDAAGKPRVATGRITMLITTDGQPAPAARRR